MFKVTIILPAILKRFVNEIKSNGDSDDQRSKLKSYLNKLNSL